MKEKSENEKALAASALVFGMSYLGSNDRNVATVNAVQTLLMFPKIIKEREEQEKAKIVNSTACGGGVGGTVGCIGSFAMGLSALGIFATTAATFIMGGCIGYGCAKSGCCNSDNSPETSSLLDNRR